MNINSLNSSPNVFYDNVFQIQIKAHTSHWVITSFYSRSISSTTFKKIILILWRGWVVLLKVLYSVFMRLFYCSFFPVEQILLLNVKFLTKKAQTKLKKKIAKQPRSLILLLTMMMEKLLRVQNGKLKTSHT
jgi:hypothetical protein